MRILAIETSCDETAAAVVEDSRKILSNIVASQVDIHARYGGIVPEVASRQHLLAIIPTIQQALLEAEIIFTDLDGIAVTIGPGLAGSLIVGVNAAKAIALANNLPIVGINHLEGHIYANWLEAEPPILPAVCLVVSGGHSELILMRDHHDFCSLGKTRDDAAGEAFDKAARILGLGYPGGPAIEKVAQEGNRHAFPLPRAWLKGNDDFSFSGLKTALLHLFEKEGNKGSQTIADMAASFQWAVVDILVRKTIEVSERLKTRQILLAGGVAANELLRSCFAALSAEKGFSLAFPPLELCTDNAAMIASCGYYYLRDGKTSGWDLDVIPNLKLGQG
jgi:N6-L-threonylcarbamoyladenine synthase